MYYKNVEIKSLSRNYRNNSASLAVEFVDSKNQTEELDKIVANYSLEINRYDKHYFMDKKGNELLVSNPKSNPDYVFINKLKLDDPDFSIDYFRNFFAGLIVQLHSKKIKNLRVNLPSNHIVGKVFNEPGYYIQSAVEGILLGNYTFDTYKTEKDTLPKLEVNLKYDNGINVDPIIVRAEKLIDSVVFTRDLVNEPAVTLTPQEFAARTKKELVKYGVSVKVFNKNVLKKRGMNAILAVGNASDNPPLLMVLEYKPGLKSAKKIALVGKGVTYDSGGLSIKPTEGMLEMNADMAGAGAVAGIIKAAAMLKLPFHLIGVIPSVENMISGRSFKPGDIIKSYSGKTIEVKDTDAEGRIILADALHYASLHEPDQIIDFATLTGAVAVALGLFTAGIFTKNDDIADMLIAAGKKVNEPVWRLPFGNEFNSLIESTVADVSNLGPRWGGAITAGKFLEHFVDKKIPYCHVDLAGPSLKHKYTNYTEKYDTGFGVRLIIDYLDRITNS